MVTTTEAVDQYGPVLLDESEMHVLRLLAQGYSNEEIAGLTYRSPDGIKALLVRIYAKLRARGRANAVHVAHESGLNMRMPDDPAPRLRVRAIEKIAEDVLVPSPPGSWVSTRDELNVHEMITEVGATLRIVRRSHTGLDATTLAIRCGVDASVISRLERNDPRNRRMPLDLVIRMCSKIGIPPSDVLRYAEDRVLGADAWWPHRRPNRCLCEPDSS
ncbi:MAG TPA: LuxR C-terminal-related transcriptional regulator [Pseudonocardiaceae bacterium]|nr:LuxR C-terminal-related transcriptional regulator [Pseudonocardiaceae bacterium]